MNRGRARVRTRAAASSLGFNEAPIHESGKGIVGRPLADRMGGFNEAPIHESGKERSPPRCPFGSTSLQ